MNNDANELDHEAPTMRKTLRKMKKVTKEVVCSAEFKKKVIKVVVKKKKSATEKN